MESKEVIPKGWGGKFCPKCGGSGRWETDEEFGARIRWNRMQLRVTLRQFARVSGIDPSDLSKMERGAPSTVDMRRRCEETVAQLVTENQAA